MMVSFQSDDIITFNDSSLRLAWVQCGLASKHPVIVQSSAMFELRDLIMDLVRCD